MDKKTVEKFKKQLIEAREVIMNSGVLDKSESLSTSKDELSDEADIANNVFQLNISFRIREQEMNKLAKINHALSMIESGEFGYCEECGEAIGMKRLEKQPSSHLCIVHAEEQEREAIFARRRSA